MTFSEIVEDAEWNLIDLIELKNQSDFYMECDVGFVMRIPEKHGTYRIISHAIGDDYNNKMWRTISMLLKSRQGPTYMQFIRNYDRLFKASQRYGSIALFDGIVLFP